MTMDEHKLRTLIEGAQSHYGTQYKKLTGAATTEAVRHYLLDLGLNVSSRDCYIRTVPREVDLLILRPAAKGHLGLIYKPEDVLCALEVKNSGSYGVQTSPKIRASFAAISAACPSAHHAYVSLSEQCNYKHAVNTVTLDGYPAFTLFTTRQQRGQYVYDPTDEWTAFDLFVKRFVTGARVLK